MDNVISLDSYKIKKVEESLKKTEEDLDKTVRGLSEDEFIKFAAYSYSEIEKNVDKRHAMIFLSKIFQTRMVYLEDLIFDQIEDDDEE